MTTQLTQVGRRVGFAAISIAVVVPVIIPGLHSGWFGSHHTNGVGGFASNPNSGSASISPIVSIGQELNEPVPTSLFTYTTTGTPTYLRLATLDRFDGSQWTVSAVSTPTDARISKGIPAPAGVTLQPAGSFDTDVTITGLRQAYLPVPTSATAVQARGDWRYNPVNPAIYGVNTSTLHLNYSATSAVYQPTPTYLNSLAAVAANETIEPYLALPSGLPPQIHQIADEIISNAGAVSQYQKALALQAWFQAGTYDISVRTGTSETALLTFLSNRRGFCEQFAATMALMARLEGIPARVDVGFTPGTKIASSDSYLVTTADAHAWPELYFPGAGWLRFEPTPRSDGQTSDPSYANAAIGPQPAASGTGVPNDVVVKPQIPHFGGGAGTAATKTRHHGFSLGKLSAGWLIAALVVLIGLVIAPVTRWATRRRRWTAADTEAARAHAAWDELGDDVRDLGLEWGGDSDTPRRAAATLVATRRLAYDVAAQQALSRLTRAEELARYAARPDELRWVDQDPRADEKAVRKALFTSVSRVRRLRARVAPPSTGRLASNATAWVGDTWHAFTAGSARWIGRRFNRSDGRDRQD